MVDRWTGDQDIQYEVMDLELHPKERLQVSHERSKCVLASIQSEGVQGDSFSKLADAARDKKPVTGWTHNFYRYPARFSPRFAAAAIECFSRPAELVLDPYMGGGTAVVKRHAPRRTPLRTNLT